MTATNNCHSRREKIAALVLGELEAPTADEIKKHIDSCENCRLLYEALTEEEEAIQSAFKAVDDRSKEIADNLVALDSNLAADIFVHELATQVTERVSIPDTGLTGEADFGSAHPTLSEDGRYVAFSSDATNLVASDGNGAKDVFVHDRDLGGTRRVSVLTGGGEADAESYTPYISGDGLHVAFASLAANLDTVITDTNGLADIFVHDVVVTETYRVSVSFAGVEANGGNSYTPSISYDGRYVAFASEAQNLDVTVPDFNFKRDIFLHDREMALQGIYDNGLTSRISLW